MRYTRDTNILSISVNFSLQNYAWRIFGLLAWKVSIKNLDGRKKFQGPGKDGRVMVRVLRRRELTEAGMNSWKNGAGVYIMGTFGDKISRCS